MKAKKKTPRSKAPYPGLYAKYHPRIRRPFLDQDYINKLTHEDKKWLSDFNEEWIGANFKHPGELIQKTDDERKECYRRNSRVNRDATSIATARGTLWNIEDHSDALERTDLYINSFEEGMDRYIDYKLTEFYNAKDS